MNTSTKPYLIRALYEWCLDSGYTPYLSVWVNEYTRVPMQYVQDEHITLSISPSATKDLLIDNEWVSFHARFEGVSQELWIPIGHVAGIFTKETGEGMGFQTEAYIPPVEATQTHNTSDGSNHQNEADNKKVLKLVK